MNKKATIIRNILRAVAALNLGIVKHSLHQFAGIFLVFDAFSLLIAPQLLSLDLHCTLRSNRKNKPAFRLRQMRLS